MNAQATEMKGIVNQLVALVGGSASHNGQAKKILGKRHSEKVQPKALPPATPKGKKEIKTTAQKALPLEEGDFKDF
jgi:hypothetical protein